MLQRKLTVTIQCEKHGCQDGHTQDYPGVVGPSDEKTRHHCTANPDGSCSSEHISLWLKVKLGVSQQRSWYSKCCFRFLLLSAPCLDLYLVGGLTSSSVPYLGADEHLRLRCFRYWDTSTARTLLIPPLFITSPGSVWAAAPSHQVVTSQRLGSVWGSTLSSSLPLRSPCLRSSTPCIFCKFVQRSMTKCIGLLSGSVNR